jgi:predicted enzyme related to lactoylglutathione lyase
MGRLIHFEIHASDPERLREFYGDLFGWQFQSWGGPMEYWLVTTGPASQAGIDGGLVRRQGPPPVEGQPVNGFVCTVDVASVDETVAAAVGKGGRVAVPRMPVPGIGWLAYLKDPDGNIFGVMQNDAAAK